MRSPLALHCSNKVGATTQRDRSYITEVESYELYSGQFDARRCPDIGCTIGLPPLNQEWDTPKYWSQEYAMNSEVTEVRRLKGTRRLQTSEPELISLLTNGGSNVCAGGSDPIPDEDGCEEAAFAIPDHTWMGSVNEADSPRGCYRYVNSSEVGNVYFNTHETGLTHEDKRILALSWESSPQLERYLVTKSPDPKVEHLIVWGLLEIGTKAHPFGWWTGAKATIKLDGSVLDTETYVYIEEETLHNKLFAVPGRIETYGVPVPDPWLRISTAVSPGAESACLVHHGSSLNWTA
eukprot:903626-Amphidinium_carterae.1